MARATFVRRHRVGIASGAALALAATAVTVYAVTAQGYKSHEAELNDGGVWVVNGKKGWSGRLNKPINELDGVVPSQDGRSRLDVVQDGASVVTVNLDSSRGQAIETTKLEAEDGGTAAIPTGAAVSMGGGTLASADPETGQVWAVRYDSQLGKPVMSAVDRQSDPLVETGKGATLAVSLGGTVVATSADEGTLTTIEPAGNGFDDPTTTGLPGEAGEVTAVTTVGERVVTLDAASGALAVVGGATAEVEPGSVLQQPGPAADTVLVTTPQELLSIDLDSGRSTVVSSASGTPVAPVRLGACVFGAWSGGLGSVATSCGSSPGEVEAQSLGGDATSLAFRVNRGEVVLNDSLSGAVWDVDQEQPARIDNWNAFTSKKKNEDDEQENENQTDADRRPPQAKPDSYGVRAGRTTVLHPLDNDSAPQGRLLSIVDVDQPTGGARVEISPDGQTLVLQMPAKARPATFEYFIDDGRNGLSAHAAVDVRVRGEGDNEAPTLRAGYEKPVYKVPHGGSLEVPVLADWRDDADGDTLLLDSARALDGDLTGAQARTTSDGRIRFTAPTAPATGPQVVKVDYAVTDGRAAPVRRSIDFAVQAPQDQQSFAPTAQPDVVRGEVGAPIKIRPLLNDLPGSDPNNPDAELSLAGKVPQQPGADVTSDLESGQVTLTADRAGTYFLSYDAGYGNAPLDRGTIRVDVKPDPKRAAPPIAMPDTLTLYGQAPGIVDVLANDLDPAGGLLTVQRAAPARDADLDVAIIDGRWLRISAAQPALGTVSQTVTYEISNGPSSGVRGEVVVTQRPAPADNTPITVNDRVVVRAGSSVSAPVLDNDVSPSGDRLTLLANVADSDVPGELDVVPPIDVKGDVGHAFVSGRVVRYVAPEKVAERDTYDVPYVATNLAGERATGHLRVTVVPGDAPNNPPEPPTLEARVVSADKVKVRLPGSGVDRDGDPVTVTGITAAPRLGRVVSYGGNFIEYQAYPRTVGTDEFTYAVVDSEGAFATGTARVAVVEGGENQPPLAVDDRLTVAPGRTATFDPLANDFIAPGDSVELELLDAPEGAEVDPDTDLVTVPAPASLGAEPVTIVYRVTNGIAESRATMTLDTAKDFDNPPVVYDAFGSAQDSGSVVVDVLDGAYDPDGDADDLVVEDVLGDPRSTVVDGSKVRADRGPSPKVLPFVVRDADGAVATASVYVPPTGTGLPYVLPGKTVRVDEGGRTTGRLSDYVAAPDGADVRVASARRSWSATPSSLSAGPDGAQGFELTAAPGYRGPGAVLVEVTTARDAGGNDDTSTTADGATALLSIPVQVGDDKPSLECPSTVLPLSAGQRYDLDIASFCKVFTVDPRDAATLDYSAQWGSALTGVDVGSPQGSVVSVSAASTATEGGEAVLDVRAGDSNVEQVRFSLEQAPPPRITPIRVDTLEAGQSRSFDIGAYLQAGVSDPDPTIVSVDSTGNPAVRASVDGGRLTLTAAKDARGAEASFRLVASDIGSDDPPPSRRVQTRLQFRVIGVPTAPGVPRTYPSRSELGAFEVSWPAPDDDGGAPVQYYIVREEKTGEVRRCDTTTCTFRGLKVGVTYSFRAQAVNRVGKSDWSELSKSAKADSAPGRVSDIQMVGRGDGTIEISWKKPTTLTSRVLTYLVSWTNGPSVEVDGSTTTYLASGLDNNTQYQFTIKARNRVDYSLPRTSEPFQPLGTPSPPPAPSVVDLESGTSQTSVRISWQGVSPEGPGPTAYTVTYTNGVTSGAVPGCQKLVALTCTHTGIPYDGQTYTYRVVAANQPVGDPANRSVPSEGTSIQAVGRPAQWGAFSVVPTGTSQEIQLQYTVPDARGTTSKVEILVDGAVNRTFPQQTGDQTVRTLLAGNERPYSVALRVCNENAPAGCTVSGAQSVQSYGRLDGMLNDIGPAAVNGKTLTWTVTGSSNGNPAELVVRLDGGPEQVRPLASAGAFTETFSLTTTDYVENGRIDVLLRDSSPGGRGQDASYNETTSGRPPDPQLIVAQGAGCNDSAEDAAARCYRGAEDTFRVCDTKDCSRIRLGLYGWDDWTTNGKVTCRVVKHPNNWFSNEAGQLSVPFEDNVGWYSPGGYVQIGCKGNKFGSPEFYGAAQW
ncbi:Ig-like domain-containing protein [Nocardioides zeicaulis]|uniref:Ig-like domain-containing protein n=1 Tax=Nocardioides zeicaulis TaxID=1776857 RepID=A0ABV6E4B1_9ACTN